ncbi:MAG: hypothetical protein Kow0059_10800 [Candidatus Sumerlaeia bacterium]
MENQRWAAPAWADVRKDRGDRAVADKKQLNLSSPVERYFDRQAAAYHDRSQGWLWSKLRQRELAACMAMLDPQAGETILDAGCGAGFYTRALIAAGAGVWAVDLSEAMTREARRAGATEVRQGDLATIELGRLFDKILCAGALEFCFDPAAVLANLSRHLSPGGRLVLLVPRWCPAGWIYYCYHRFHGLRIHLFRWTAIRRLGNRAGLTDTCHVRPAFSIAVRFDKPADRHRS